MDFTSEDLKIMLQCLNSVQIPGSAAERIAQLKRDIGEALKELELPISNGADVS